VLQQYMGQPTAATCTHEIFHTTYLKKTGHVQQLQQQAATYVVCQAPAVACCHDQLLRPRTLCKPTAGNNGRMRELTARNRETIVIDCSALLKPPGRPRAPGWLLNRPHEPRASVNHSIKDDSPHCSTSQVVVRLHIYCTFGYTFFHTFGHPFGHSLPSRSLSEEVPSSPRKLRLPFRPRARRSCPSGRVCAALW
jgi:hypothetical protein